MYWSSLLTIVTLPATLALPWHEASKRANYAATDATLYAYGTNISGLPVLYGLSDGFLYISPDNTTVSGLVSVTWDIPTMSSATTTTSPATLWNGTSPGSMFIDPSGGSFDNVQVTRNASSSSNGTTKGFASFGKQVIYYNGSALQSEFWAKQTEIDGNTLWTLVWNSDNESQDGATPVTIKTVAPASL